MNDEQIERKLLAAKLIFGGGIICACFIKMVEVLLKYPEGNTLYIVVCIIIAVVSGLLGLTGIILLLFFK